MSGREVFAQTNHFWVVGSLVPCTHWPGRANGHQPLGKLRKRGEERRGEERRGEERRGEAVVQRFPREMPADPVSPCSQSLGSRRHGPKSSVRRGCTVLGHHQRGFALRPSKPGWDERKSGFRANLQQPASKYQLLLQPVCCSARRAGPGAGSRWCVTTLRQW